VNAAAVTAMVRERVREVVFMDASKASVVVQAVSKPRWKRR
jgi:hypothetical protein